MPAQQQKDKAGFWEVALPLTALVVSFITVSAATYGWLHGQPIPKAYPSVDSAVGWTWIMEVLTAGAWGLAMLVSGVLPGAVEPKSLGQVIALAVALVVTVPAWRMLLRAWNGWMNSGQEPEPSKAQAPRTAQNVQAMQRGPAPGQGKQVTQAVSKVPAAAGVQAGQNAAPAQQQRVVMPPPDPRAFDGLVGVDHAVEAIKEALELPIKYPEKVKKFRLKPAKGILFYGPPGTGKTSLARATARYFGCSIAVITPAYLLDCWVGNSEKKVNFVFRDAQRHAAATGRPVILFFDEIDAIGRRRDGQHMNRAPDVVLNQLLAELDGVTPNTGIFVMAATNRLDVLDEALLRPGRFDKLIEIGLPNAAARRELFRRGLAGRPVAGDIDLDALVERTKGFSPAAITNACDQAAQAAAMRSIRTGVEAITMGDLLEAVKQCGESSSVQF